MLKINEKVATKNAQIYKMVVLEMTNEVISTYSRLTTTPVSTAGGIKEIWSLEKLIQGFDMTNADLSEGDSSICTSAGHTEDDVYTSLTISWEKLTDDEIDLIKDCLIKN